MKKDPHRRVEVVSLTNHVLSMLNSTTYYQDLFSLPFVVNRNSFCALLVCSIVLTYISLRRLPSISYSTLLPFCSISNSYSTSSLWDISFTTIDFTFTNSRVPNCDSSLPSPEHFIPPKGNLGSDLTISFTRTTPLRISRASLTPLSNLLVHMLAPNPNSELFASQIASVSLSTTIMGAAGPNTSSLKITIL